MLLAGGLWILVLLGVGTIGWLHVVMSGLAGLGSHGGAGGGDLTALAAGGLVALGVVVAVVVRLILGQGKIGHAARISAAGIVPFVVGLLAEPNMFIRALHAASSRSPMPTLAVLATVLSLGGVVLTVRGALAPHSGSSEPGRA